MHQHSLTAANCLAENSVPIFDRVLGRLATAIGVEIVLLSGCNETAMVAGEADVAWACGLLTRQLITAGQMDADIVAAPIFLGESRPVYHSVIAARRESGFESLSDCAGSRLAINETGSWSGHHGLAAHLGESGHSLTMFGEVVETGSHHRSVAAIERGDADVAAIDHTVWEHLVATPDVTDLVVIERTSDWPAPPFSIGRSLDVEIRERVLEGLLGIGSDDVEGLAGVVQVSAGDYDLMRRDEQPAG